MGQVVADRVKETSTTTGTGAFTVLGATVGHRALSAVLTVGDTVPYTIEGVNPDGSLTGEWEVGVGTYSGANTLTRTTVLSSSNAGAAVNFSAGTKQVWIDLPAALVVPRLATGEVGLRAAPSTDAALTVGAPSGAGATLHGANYDLTAPATASTLYGIKSVLRTAAAAFTLGLAAHFSANAGSLGAGSAITEVRGFEALTGAAVGGTNRAFYTDYTQANGHAVYTAGTAPSFFNGTVAVATAASTTSNALRLSLPSTVNAATVDTIAITTTAPSTTSSHRGVRSDLGSAATAFTLTLVEHYSAQSTTVGAGSTITTVRGFYASNNIATGTNNYAFYSDIVAGTGRYGFYSAGTAQNYFGGPVGIQNTNPAGNNALFQIGGAHPSTATTIFGSRTEVVVPATATSTMIGHYTVITTASAAFTVSEVSHFRANQTVIGAGSAVTTVYGFRAESTIATAASNNYGFYSGLNGGSGAWAFYGGGTAHSYFGGPVNLLSGNGATDVLLRLGSSSSTHPSTSGSTFGTYLDLACTASVTTTFTAHSVILRTPNSAFTVNTLYGYRAQAWSRGAASTVTTAAGFVAENGIAVGSTNYGFWSNINAAANTWQLYMAGTADSFFGGPVGLLSAPIAATVLSLGGNHPSTAATINGVWFNTTIPATATGNLYQFRAGGATSAASYTVSTVNGFAAIAFTVGAGSSVTTTRAFYAANAFAVGGTNYGFISDIAPNGVNTWQLYMAGGAKSYFGGTLGVLNASPDTAGAVIMAGGTHPSAAATGYHMLVDATIPATMTASWNGYYSTVATVAGMGAGAVIHFRAANTVLAGGATATTVYGFLAGTAAISGKGSTASYGFYSDIADAANTYQLAMVGSATSYVMGRFGVGAASVFAGAAMIGVGSVTHPSTAATLYGAAVDIVAPSTATNGVYIYRAVGRTAAAAFTLANLVLYMAEDTILGAGSTITNVMGFYANNLIAGIATNTYGFYSDMVAATNTFALYLSGTASAAFGGALYPAKETRVIQSNCALFAGSGAPNNSNGNNGDVYFRSDGGAGTTLYQKRAGAWVGLL